MALPAYQDYTIRAKATEGIILGTSLKIVVADNAANGTSNATGGLFSGMATGIAAAVTTYSGAGTCAMQTPTATSGLTKNVSSITGATTNGLITIAYPTSLVPAAANTLNIWPSSGSTALVAAVPLGGPIIWTCFAAEKTAINGYTATTNTLLQKYAPAECRKIF